MKPYLNFVILVLLITTKGLHAQEDKKRDAFVSINSGIYVPSRSEFKTIYDSWFTFNNGLSAGVPFTNSDIYLYGKAMFLRCEGVPIIYHYESIDGVLHTYTTREGNIIYKQLLFNLGIQYNYSIKKLNKIITNGGISIINATETTTNTNADSESKAKGFAGYFIGLGYERNFENTPLSAFSEIQYNFNRLIFKALDLSYGGANINVGVRFYFKQ
ncbi:MAG: hypothetical protein WCR58_05350 [Bacteroidales bacterium]|jgi:hypothetical protein|nr:hypothetical protein [Bacteroidales bacterium]MDY0369099.1 hypothetical protein [Bacteroidales bacterium]